MNEGTYFTRAFVGQDGIVYEVEVTYGSDPVDDGMLLYQVVAGEEVIARFTMDAGALAPMDYVTSPDGSIAPSRWSSDPVDITNYAKQQLTYRIAQYYQTHPIVVTKPDPIAQIVRLVQGWTLCETDGKAVIE